MNPQDEDAPSSGEGTLISHLVELRARLLKTVLAIFLVFLALTPFSDTIFVLLATPLMEQLPEGTSMIATRVASPFLTPFKLTLVVAIFLTMPMTLYQIWSFVAPGLYRQEKRFAVPLLVTSAALFYLGIAFAYFVVFPLMFAFFTGVAPSGVEVMTDITSYLDFVLTLFFAFGVAFEVPIAVVLLVWTGLVTPADLAKKRPYVFLGAFISGMLLTPPDVISQALLAFPVYVLYELGIVLSRMLVARRREAEAQEQEPS